MAAVEPPPPIPFVCFLFCDESDINVMQDDIGATKCESGGARFAVAVDLQDVEEQVVKIAHYFFELAEEATKLQDVLGLVEGLGWKLRCCVFYEGSWREAPW